MYTTTYGDQINDDFLKGMNRIEIRNGILELLEKEAFANGSPIAVTFGDSVPNDRGGTSCGSIVPLTKWRMMMNILEFEERGSSTAGWKIYEMGGLISDNRSESSVAKVTFIEDRSWRESKIGHSLVIHYRKKDGGFFVYTGNVEDFYEQVMVGMKPVYYAKVAKSYNV